MGTRTVHDCDRCGKKDVAVVQVAVKYGWCPDPAGGVGAPDFDVLELCPSCAKYALRLAVDRLPEAERLEWAAGLMGEAGPNWGFLAERDRQRKRAKGGKG